MACFNVFLDSNVFINGKYDFNAGSLSILKKQCERGNIGLFTNDIVLREVRHHICNDIGLLAKQAKNAIKKDWSLVNAISQDSYERIKSILLDAPKRLTDEFETFMNGVTILPIDGLSMVTLFDDYFGSSAPFETREEKKHEFPDAVIIMSINRYLKENDQAIMHVVTDDNGWHKAFSGSDRVFFYKDIKALLTEISKADETDLFKQIAQHMGDRLGSLQSAVWDWLYEQEWSLLIDNVEMCIECDEVEDMHIDTIELVPNSIEYINKEDSYAVAGFSGVSKIRLDFSYIDHTDEIYDREDHAWLNTVYGEGRVQIEVPLGGSVTISLSDNGDLDFETPSFNQIDLREIEISECELTPHRVDDDPFFDICPDCGKPIGIHNDGGNGFCTECAPQH